MHPVLFEIPLLGGISIYTYGVLYATAVLVIMLWIGYEAKRLGEDPTIATDMVFYVVIGAILGGRAAYVLVSEPEQFFRDPLSFFRIWEGGLVHYGGFIMSLLVAFWYTRRHHLKFWRMADIVMPGLALSHAIGRMGCFFAGCCYGRPVAHDHWWALTFPAHANGFAPTGVALYPTQLMSVVSNLSIFGLLFFFRKHKTFDGQIFVLYLVCYAIGRSIIEYYRGDSIRGFVFHGLMSTSQAISGVMILFAVLVWAVQRKKGVAS